MTFVDMLLYIFMYIILMFFSGVISFGSIYRLEFQMAIISAIIFIGMWMNNLIIYSGIKRIFKREKWQLKEFILFVIAVLSVLMIGYNFVMGAAYAA